MKHQLSILALAAATCMTVAHGRPPKPPVVPRPAPDRPVDSCGKSTVPLQPIYPITALRKAQPGWVVVEFSLAADGTVSATRVVDSSPETLFDEAAIQAVQRAKFPASTEARDGCMKLIEFSIGRWDT